MAASDVRDWSDFLTMANLNLENHEVIVVNEFNYYNTKFLLNPCIIISKYSVISFFL